MRNNKSEKILRVVFDQTCATKKLFSRFSGEEYDKLVLVTKYGFYDDETKYYVSFYVKEIPGNQLEKIMCYNKTITEIKNRFSGGRRTFYLPEHIEEIRKRDLLLAAIQEAFAKKDDMSGDSIFETPISFFAQSSIESLNSDNLSTSTYCIVGVNFRKYI